MLYEPRPHQKIAAQWLKTHNRAGLFLDMGLGKTVVTLTHVKELLDDFAINKALVIAPLRVAQDTWSRESEKWDHLAELTISRVLGTRTQREAALHKNADVYVINRENVQWLVEYIGNKWPFDMVVIDELSSFKSASSKRWRCLKRVIKLAKYVVGLTGTPAPNGYIDLWPEIYMLDSGASLGRTLGEYRSRYFDVGAHKGHIVYEWKLKRGAKERIDRQLSDLCLSMSKDDWLQLPPVIYNIVICRMNDEERKMYDHLRNESILPLLRGALSEVRSADEVIVGTTAGTLSNKLLQLACGCAYDDSGKPVPIHARKLDALEDIRAESHGQPLLVFYSYVFDRDRILERFPEAEVMKDSDTIDRWNRGEIPMLLCHPASCSYGINLQQGGHIIVWYGLTFSLEQYTQANARLHRMGQGESVIVHHLICENTIDEKVMAVLEQKDATQRGLLDALKEYVKEVAE